MLPRTRDSASSPWRIRSEVWQACGIQSIQRPTEETINGDVRAARPSRDLSVGGFVCEKAKAQKNGPNAGGKGSENSLDLGRKLWPAQNRGR